MQSQIEILLPNSHPPLGHRSLLQNGDICREPCLFLAHLRRAQRVELRLVDEEQLEEGV